ncbi:hypothetical protein [Vibrio scophthalmi]|uniref:Uncharacterized protein n=1 Tax=Vibrio scophthalmi LMG 19158 TaxID=870967 RepID=F9RQN8_9VIBR|nr:hypothetical protein [Vibrio scophthalmi]EGU33969.1 hypothetical protein VIS19158_10949 [Vibrio scophthalmi LMG 19158]
MTLKECRECKELMLSNADVCSHCGATNYKEKFKLGVMLVLGFVFVLGLFLLTEAQ